MSQLRLLNRVVFVVGGALVAKEKECLDSIEFCDGLNKFELLKGSLSEARRSPAFAPTSDGLLIVGGCNNGVHLSSIECLHTNTMSIKQHTIHMSKGFSCAAYCQMRVISSQTSPLLYCL